MSAFVAVLSRVGVPDREAVVRALRASPHRGVTQGVILRGRVAIGTAVQSQHGDAGMAEYGGWAAAIAGRIDNVDDLKAQLARDGHPVPDASPAMVSLHAFRAWGSACPERFRGTFAVAVTDGSSLWTFRDHLGLVTLFYRDSSSLFVAASEAKQVVAATGIPYEPDLEVLESIFYSTYDDATPSALKGVWRLPKATLLHADEAGARSRVYWHPERLIETGRYSDDALAERFHELMEQASARALTGKGDVIALSGGIDSPAVAAYAAPVHRAMTGRPLGALSAVYPDIPSCDETPYIEAVADQLHLDLHTFRREAPALDGLQEWVRLFDGPAPQWTVSQGAEFHVMASSLGFSNILTGEVAEFVIDMRQHLVDHLLLTGQFGALGRYLRSLHERGYTKKGLYRQVLGALAPRPMLSLYLRVRSPKDPYRPDWLEPQQPDERPQYGSYSRRARERWQTGQVVGFNGPGLSMEADHIAQLLAGVRTRRPFADVDLWEFFLSIPAAQKFPSGESKGLVRRWLRGRVPDMILDRTDKTHFNDYVMRGVDYAALRSRLVDPPHPVHGVDYARLRTHIEARDFTLGDYIWARDLAAVHAFQGLWD